MPRVKNVEEGPKHEQEPRWQWSSDRADPALEASESRSSYREAEDQIRCYAPARQVMPGPPGMPSPTRPHDFAKRNLGGIEKPAERASVVGSRHQRQPLPVRWL